MREISSGMRQGETINNPELNHREMLTEILTRDLPSHELPDAFFSYSGGIVERNEKVLTPDTPEVSRYKTMSYTDVGEHGLITGGKARVIATAEIAKTLPDMKIVTTSRYYADWPTHAAVIENELINKGVDPEQIVREEESFSTITEIVEMIKMAVKNNWFRVVAITNEYHLPRMSEMLNQVGELFAHDEELQQALAKFRENHGEIALISAEEVLSKLDPRWAKLVEAARKTELYQKTVAAEERGLNDLLAGEYKVSTAPKELPTKGSQPDQKI